MKLKGNGKGVVVVLSQNRLLLLTNNFRVMAQPELRTHALQRATEYTMRDGGWWIPHINIEDNAVSLAAQTIKGTHDDK